MHSSSSKIVHVHQNSGQNQNQNYGKLKSESDLCGNDEIDFLLEEIRDFEPANYRIDDIQDFEIAGSQTGARAAPTECVTVCQCGRESPLDTVVSWDSHSNYQHLLPSAKKHNLITIYFDYSKLFSTIGIIRTLFFISSLVCLLFLCSSGTKKVPLFMLPLATRLRFMLFVTLLAVSSVFMIIFLEVTHLIRLFPFNWTRINTSVYATFMVMFLAGTSLIFHMIFVSEHYFWVPKWTHRQLLITACFGCICVIELILLVVYENVNISKYKKVTDESKNNSYQMQPLMQSLIHKNIPCPSQKKSNYIAITSYQKIDSITFKRQENKRTASQTANGVETTQPGSAKSNFK